MVSCKYQPILSHLWRVWEWDYKPSIYLTASLPLLSLPPQSDQRFFARVSVLDDSSQGTFLASIFPLECVLWIHCVNVSSGEPQILVICDSSSECCNTISTKHTSNLYYCDEVLLRRFCWPFCFRGAPVYTGAAGQSITKSYSLSRDIHYWALIRMVVFNWKTWGVPSVAYLTVHSWYVLDEDTAC